MNNVGKEQRGIYSGVVARQQNIAFCDKIESAIYCNAQYAITNAIVVARMRNAERIAPCGPASNGAIS